MLDLLLRVCFPSAAALCVVTVWFMFFGSVQLRGRWCMYLFWGLHPKTFALSASPRMW
jgi:hypothetical protein